MHERHSPVDADDDTDRPDADLLAAYARRRDPDALAVLIDRHGPMVYATCRRVLGDPHEADDAFQAVFLVLIRKAGTVRGDQLAGWLHGVAVRTAKASRKLAARRQRLDQKYRAANTREAVEDPDLVEAADLREVLDRELGRLTPAARNALLLCDLEGRSRKQAAAELGWPEGTLATRLARAREVLARRLVRLGIVPSVAVALLLLAREAKAQVPPTVRDAALGLATGPAAKTVTTLATATTVGAGGAVFWAGAGVVTVGIVVCAVMATRPGGGPAAPVPKFPEKPPEEWQQGGGPGRGGNMPQILPAGDWEFIACEPGGRTVAVRVTDGRTTDLPLRLPEGAVLSREGKRATWVGVADGRVPGQLFAGDALDGPVRGTWINPVKKPPFPQVFDPDWVPGANKVVVAIDPTGLDQPPDVKGAVFTVTADGTDQLEPLGVFPERVSRPKMSVDGKRWACLHDAGKAGNVPLHNLVLHTAGDEAGVTVVKGKEVIDFCFCPLGMYLAYSVAGEGLTVVTVQDPRPTRPIPPAAMGLDDRLDYGHLFCRRDVQVLGFRPVFVRGTRIEGKGLKLNVAPGEVRGLDRVGFVHLMEGMRVSTFPLPPELRPVGWRPMGE